MKITNRKVKQLFKLVKERNKEIRAISDKYGPLEHQIDTIQSSCKHVFPQPPFFHGVGKVPKGMTSFLDSETCIKCGLDCHDPEEWK